MRKMTLLAVLFLLASLAACGASGGSGEDEPGEDTGGWNNDLSFVGNDTEPGIDTVQVDTPETDVPAEEVACVPACSGKDCGPDGCGDFCGECTGTKLCNGEGKCVAPEDPCADKECGPDGKGGSCGECGYPTTCNAEGQCTATKENLSCKEILFCYNDCEANDDACLDECYEAGTETAKAIEDALETCLAANGFAECKSDVTCQDKIIADYCQDEYDACLPPGTLTCEEINGCVDNCPEETFTACATDCITDGTVIGQEQYGTFVDCAIANGFNDCTTGTCQFDVIEQSCSEEYDICLQATKNCKDLWDCMQNCDSDDTVCQDICQDGVEVKAGVKYMAYINCLIDNCGNPPTQECLKAAQDGACKATYTDCFSTI